MEVNVTGDDAQAENDECQTYVRFEANRIAQRRVFEEERVPSINEPRTMVR